MSNYDYLVVGAGLFGAVFAREAALAGKKVKVIEKRGHIAGNIYTKEVKGIQVHEYGAHIFHTSDKEIWDYVNQFAEFNRYTNTPIANYKGEIYNLPFNMNTFNKLWGVVTPAEALAKIEEQKQVLKGKEPSNLEEQAINDTYQGIPIGGYTQIVEKMLAHPNIDVETNVDFFANKESFLTAYPKVVFTGMIDEFFDYQLGELEYRSLRFETETLDMENYQGNAVVNYTDSETSYTRIIEHKHFEFGTQPKTIITKEYSKTWQKGDEPYYPVNNEENNRLYAQYIKLAEEQKNVIFGGRLGMYRYFDMHQVIAVALKCVRNELAQ